MLTREKLSLMESTGVFEGTHLELIEGVLIDKTGKITVTSRAPKP